MATKLSASHGLPVENPSATQVTHALLDIEDDNGSFVIVDTAHGFIQTATSTEKGLLLEYRLSDSSIINRAVRMDLSVEEVAIAMEKFRRNDLSWTTDYAWTTEDLGGSDGTGTGCAGVLVLLSIALGLTLLI